MNAVEAVIEVRGWIVAVVVVGAEPIPDVVARSESAVAVIDVGE